MGGLKDVSGVLEGLLKLQKQIGVFSDAKMVSVIYLEFVRWSLQSAWVVLNDVWAFLEVSRWFLGGLTRSLRVSKRSLWVLEGLQKL